MTSEWRVVIDDPANDAISGAALDALPIETGGLLLGYYTNRVVHVRDAIEVPDPAATPNSYTRQRSRAQHALNRALRHAPSHYGYVGDWHSHPLPIGASDRDRKTTSLDAAEKGKPLVLVVAAYERGTIGLQTQIALPDEVTPAGQAGTSDLMTVTKSKGRRGLVSRAMASEWWRIRAVSVYLAVVGAILILVTWGAIVRNSDGTGAALAVLGGGSLIIAAFAPYIEGTLKLGGLELSIRTRLIDAATRANRDELDAVVSLLEDDDITVRRVVVPEKHLGHRLVDESMQFVRQQLDISAIALRRRDDTEWVAGGRVSEAILEEGTVLLLAGPPESIDAFLRD